MRFRSFVERCREPYVDVDGVRYVHQEITGVCESGHLLHMRRRQGMKIDDPEDAFLLEVGHLFDYDLHRAQITRVSEAPDGDGASMRIHFETTQLSMFMELTQKSCRLKDLEQGTDERIGHHHEMFNQIELAKRKFPLRVVS